jgi:hypothetical protein
MNNALFVAYRSGDPSQTDWSPVGKLEHADGLYRFTYTRGARTLRGFDPFPGMTDLSAVYESDTLFPLFANRLLARSRPEYEAYLTWSGFDPAHPPDPLAILGVTEGIRQTDQLEVFPCPAPDADGCYLTKFFVHGLRWMHPAAVERAGRLKPGGRLALMPDIQNPHDPYAVALRTTDDRDRLLIGYAPRYLARDFTTLWTHCDPDFIQVTVERLNGSAPLQMRVLCRMNACWPKGFRPCNDETYQPIVAAGEAIRA